MSHFDFEVTRESKPRPDRGRAVRLTLLFCVIAAITALIIYLIIPAGDAEATQDNPPAATEEQDKNDTPGVVDPDNTGNDQKTPSADNADPAGKDSSAENTPAKKDDSAEKESDQPAADTSSAGNANANKNGSESASAAGKNENTAKFDPSIQDLFNHTDKLRSMLANGSWKKSDFAIAHTVIGGDRMANLAAKYNNTRMFVRHYNELDANATIRINQKLYFLRADSWQITISRKENTLQLNRIVDGKAIPFAIFHCRINAKGFSHDLVVNSHQYKPTYNGDHGTRFKFGTEENPYGEYLLALARAKNPANPVYYLSIFDCKNQQSEAVPLKNGATILNNEDISLLYTLVPDGTPVKIVE